MKTVRVKGLPVSLLTIVAAVVAALVLYVGTASAQTTPQEVLDANTL
jgi:hypothetical protein